jgi:hypothetical protein
MRSRVGSSSARIHLEAGHREEDRREDGERDVIELVVDRAGRRGI